MNFSKNAVTNRKETETRLLNRTMRSRIEQRETTDYGKPSYGMGKYLKQIYGTLTNFEKKERCIFTIIL